MNSFYEAIIDKKNKVVAFAGGGGKSVLINDICHNCETNKISAVVMSLFSLFLPHDTKTFIADDINIIKSQLSKELKKNKVIYLGRKYSENKIDGFNAKDLNHFIDHVAADHIFLEADHVKSRSMSGFDNVVLSALSQIDRCVFVIGADALNQKNDDKHLNTSDPFWRKKDIIDPVDIADWFDKQKIVSYLKSKEIPITFYINKVEDIFHQNLAITLARRLKLLKIDRVVYGSVFNSEYHIVR